MPEAIRLGLITGAREVPLVTFAALVDGELDLLLVEEFLCRYLGMAT